MSSNQQPDRGPRHGWSLRSRLLAMLMLVLAAVCVVVGAATELTLHRYLVGQTDDRLEGASERTAGRFGPGVGPRDPLTFLNAPGLGPGTIGARLARGRVSEAGVLPLRSRFGPVELPVDTYDVFESVPVDSSPHTVRVPGYGRYRMLATTMNGDDVLVTGLPLEPVHDTLWRLAYVVLAVSALALLAAGVGGSALIRVTLRPLNRVAATAARVAELPLHAGEVALVERVPPEYTDPRTEVGQVGSALNRMLGHVDAALVARQASETRLRQFVADASHELRTPLASIRGYAELGRSRESEAAGALERVENQAKRMTVLVEDLLLLARIDAGRPLDLGPVDLSALVVESIGDAHVAGPQHRWRLDLPEEPVVVTGDGARLHQVLTNLLANARTHTPPGTEVTVGITRTGVLAVRDDGPGIPPELQPHIFQRFARGDGSRSRTAGSTGLGLSIVDAVVQAHGGSVGVHSRPGRTVFTVVLPLHAAPTDPAQEAHTTGTAEPSIVEG